MKKITNLLLAASVIAFSASCNKEIDQVVPDQTAKSTVLTAHVDNGSNTRTSLNDVNVIWSANDAIVAFAGTTSYTSTNTEVRNDGLTAKFTFNGEIEPTYAFYPADGASIDNNGVISSTIPSEQVAVSGTFANGASLAIAKVEDVDDIHFKNVGALVAFKINAPDHNVVSMTLYGTETSGKGMTGLVAVSIDGNNEVTTSCTGEDYVKVQGAFAADNYYYAVIAPGTYSNVSIVFTDNQGKTATYTKNANLEINRNDHIGLGEFSPSESRWQSAQTDSYYLKVTSSDNLTSGQYLIVCEDESLAFNGGLNTLDATSNTINVTIDDGTIESNSTTDAAIFYIDITAGTIKSASGSYIGRSGDSNGLNSSTTEAYTNTISFDDDGNAVVVSSGGAYLRYNSASNQERFRYFKSSTYTGQKAIALYKLTTTPPKVLSRITLSGNYPTEFYVNDAFSYEGLTVTAHFDDNSTAIVTPTSVSTPNLSQVADNISVTVSYIYNGVLKKASYDISVVERPVYTVTLADDNTTLTTSSDGSVTLPSRPVTVEGYTFEGWSETNITTATTTAPEIILAGSYAPAQDVTLYPVYSSGENIDVWQRTELSDVSEGLYVLLTNNNYAFNGTITSGHGQSTTNDFTFNSEGWAEYDSTPEGTVVFEFVASGAGFQMKAEGKGFLYAKEKKSGNLAWHSSENSYWYVNSNGHWEYEANGALLRVFDNTFRTYGNAQSNELSLAKKTTIINRTYISNPS